MEIAESVVSKRFYDGRLSIYYGCKVLSLASQKALDPFREFSPSSHLSICLKVPRHAQIANACDQATAIICHGVMQNMISTTVNH